MDSPPLKLVVAALLTLVACSTPPQPDTTDLLDSDHPAEQLRGQVVERNISAEEAAEQLDELRTDIGVDEPAQFHLASARVNAYEGYPLEALYALEAALEADDSVVDDAIRLELAEQALRAGLSERRGDDKIERAYEHLLTVDPYHPRIQRRALDQYRVERLDDLHTRRPHDDDALAEAAQICDESLDDSPVIDAFVIPCARTAYQLGDFHHARRILYEWIDDKPGLFEQLEALFDALDEVNVNFDEALVLQRSAPEQLQWRASLADLLADQTMERIEAADKRLTGTVPAFDRVRTTKTPMTLAYLADDIETASYWGPRYETVSRRAAADFWPTGGRRGGRDKPARIPHFLVALIYTNDERLDDALVDDPEGTDNQVLNELVAPELEDIPDDTVAELHDPNRVESAVLHLCEYTEALSSDKRGNLGVWWAIFHDGAHDETAIEQCEFSPRQLKRNRNSFHRTLLAGLVRGYHLDEPQQVDSLTQWIDDAGFIPENITAHCREFSCPNELYNDLSRSGVDAISDAEIPVLPPRWADGGALAPIHGSVPSPTGDRLATFHVGEEPQQYFGMPVHNPDDGPDFEQLAPTSLVVWDEETGTQLQRFELPLDADDVTLDRARDVDNATMHWNDEFITTVAGQRLIIVDLQTGDSHIEEIHLDEDTPARRFPQIHRKDTSPHLPPVVTDDNTLTFVRPAYRRGPLIIEQRPLDDLDDTEQTTLWAKRAFHDWHKLLSSGHLVRNSDEGLEFEREDGTSFEVTLSGVPAAEFRLADDGNTLYAIADNVYAIDLNKQAVLAAFGSCPWGEDDEEASLPHSEPDSGDDMISAGLYDGYDGTPETLPQPILNCDQPLTPAIHTRGEIAITFAADEGGELPLTPLFHYQRSRHRLAIDLTDGETVPTDCNDVPDEQLQSLIAGVRPPDDDAEELQQELLGTSYGGQDTGDADCVAATPCSIHIVEEAHASVTNSPMVLGNTSSSSYDRDEPVLAWVDEHREGFRTLRFGTRGTTTSLQFSGDSSRLLTSVFGLNHSLLVRDTESGRLAQTVPGFLPLSAQFIPDDNSILNTGFNQRRTDPYSESTERLAVGQWSIDDGNLTGCPTTENLPSGDEAALDEAGAAQVHHISYDDEEFGLHRLTDQQAEDKIEKLTYEKLERRLGDDFEEQLEEQREDIQPGIFGPNEPRVYRQARDEAQDQVREQFEAQPTLTKEWLLVGVDDRWLFSPSAEPMVDDIDRITRADACPDANVVAIAELDDEMHIRNLDGDLIERIHPGDQHRITAAAFDDDCRLGLAFSPDDHPEAAHQFAIVEADDDGAWAETRRTDTDITADVGVLQFHPDGWLIAATEPGSVVLIDPNDGAVALQLSGLSAEPTALTVDPQGHYIAAGTAVGDTVTWQMPVVDQISGGELPETREARELFEQAIDDDTASDEE